MIELGNVRDVLSRADLFPLQKALWIEKRVTEFVSSSINFDRFG